MSVFADTSSLVKLYVPEAGAAAVRRLAEPLVVSQLARVEVPAALWRKHRTGEVVADDPAMLVQVFEADWRDERFAAIQVGAVLDDTARLVAVHGLRGYDAVQLASAVAARGADPSIDEFSTFDAALGAAAAAEGFRPTP